MRDQICLLRRCNNVCNITPMSVDRRPDLIDDGARDVAIEALEAAIAAAGSQSALARAVNQHLPAGSGLSQLQPQNVSSWVRAGRGAPADYCPAIQLATGVACQRLRPLTYPAWLFADGAQQGFSSNTAQAGCPGG